MQYVNQTQTPFFLVGNTFGLVTFRKNAFGKIVVFDFYCPHQSAALVCNSIFTGLMLAAAATG